MPDPGSVVVIGGTQGLGLEVARHYSEQGREVVLSGRDPGRAAAVAAEVGGKTRGIGLDLAEPSQLAERLAGVGLLALGGALYTAGAIVYARRRPDPRPEVFGYHEIFHVLVIAAAAVQYAAVAIYALPAAS